VEKDIMDDIKKKRKRTKKELKALAEKNSTCGKTHVHPLAAAQVGTDVVGNGEYEELEKRDYGFDGETRKFLSSEDYMPE
jgi:hypothetical protein